MSQRDARLHKELKYFSGDECDENFCAGPIDENNRFIWIATIPGPEDTPYEGGFFDLKIDFPATYPFEPPVIYFETKVYHQDIRAKDGFLDWRFLKFLKYEWDPQTRLIEILKGIQTLLAEPDTEYYWENEINKQYLEDRVIFNKIAREWTEKYAK